MATTNTTTTAPGTGTTSATTTTAIPINTSTTKKKSNKNFHQSHEECDIIGELMGKYGKYQFYMTFLLSLFQIPNTFHISSPVFQVGILFALFLVSYFDFLLFRCFRYMVLNVFARKDIFFSTS